MNTITKLILMTLAAGQIWAGEPDHHLETARLAAICRGPGTIRPDYNGKFLVVGKEYTVVAQPRASSLFTNWTDGYERVITNFPRLSFVMKTNTVIIANFRKHDWPAADVEGASLGDMPLRVLRALNAAPPAERAATLESWLAQVPGSVLPSVVSTVVRAYPSLLTPAVQGAVSSAPAEAYAIVYAAALTPGANLRMITAGGCAAAPGQCYQIAQAILDINPNAGKILLQTIAASVPQLAPLIGTSGSGNSLLSKQQTLDILSHALTVIGWPALPAPPNQLPRDYSLP